MNRAFGGSGFSIRQRGVAAAKNRLPAALSDQHQNGVHVIRAERAEILIAEDSPTQAERLRSVLAGGGYRVRVARDGRRALDAVRERAPDLVLSDILMPELDLSLIHI